MSADFDKVALRFVEAKISSNQRAAISRVVFLQSDLRVMRVFLDLLEPVDVDGLLRGLAWEEGSETGTIRRGRPEGGEMLGAVAQLRPVTVGFAGLAGDEG